MDIKLLLPTPRPIDSQWKLQYAWASKQLKNYSSLEVHKFLIFIDVPPLIYLYRPHLKNINNVPHIHHGSMGNALREGIQKAMDQNLDFQKAKNKIIIKPIIEFILIHEDILEKMGASHIHFESLLKHF